MTLLLLTNFSTILIVFLILSFIKEHFNVEKFPSKTKMITTIVIFEKLTVFIFLQDKLKEEL